MFSLIFIKNISGEERKLTGIGKTEGGTIISLNDLIISIGDY